MKKKMSIEDQIVVLTEKTAEFRKMDLNLLKTHKALYTGKRDHLNVKINTFAFISGLFALIVAVCGFIIQSFDGKQPDLVTAKIVYSCAIGILVFIMAFYLLGKSKRNDEIFEYSSYVSIIDDVIKEKEREVEQQPNHQNDLHAIPPVEPSKVS
ncbi:hypothetical protein [Paenibacillus sp. MMO-58]|uniref:hypothetical protein n=1 Tax=Paenibacillus sp. MMO-58 TaxID=3081290 RepID=UPI0030178D6D